MVMVFISLWEDLEQLHLLFLQLSHSEFFNINMHYIHEMRRRCLTPVHSLIPMHVCLQGEADPWGCVNLAFLTVWLLIAGFGQWEALAGEWPGERRVCGIRSPFPPFTFGGIFCSCLVPARAVAPIRQFPTRRLHLQFCSHLLLPRRRRGGNGFPPLLNSGCLTSLPMPSPWESFLNYLSWTLFMAGLVE